MATLEDLVKVDGVVAAGEFKQDGTLVDYRANMDMSPQLAAQAAQFCATVSMLFDTLGGAFEGSAACEDPAAGVGVQRRAVHGGGR
jgi:roadblock/LC7 domain-containing protein